MSKLKEHCPVILLLVIGAPLVGYVLSDNFLDELHYRQYGPARVNGISDLRCNSLDGSIDGRVYLTSPEGAVIGVGLYTKLEGVWARVDDTEVEFEISKEEVELPETRARPDGGVRWETFKTDEAEFELYSPVTDRVRAYQIRAEWSSTERVVARSQGEHSAPLLLSEFTC